VSLIPTNLDIWFELDDGTVVTLVPVGTTVNIISNLTSADTGEGLNGKTVVLTMTRPDGSIITYTMWEMVGRGAGFYCIRLNPTFSGVYTWQSEFAGDETYAGCDEVTDETKMNFSLSNLQKFPLLSEMLLWLRRA